MLTRNLGPLQIQLISLGGVIGSAYFIGVGTLLAENGPFAIFAFLVGGMIAWLVAMAMGELCVGMAREGSFVSQTRELMGRPWAAGMGWSYWFNWCAFIPSEMIAGGMILHQFFPQVSVILWASLFAAFITVINLLNIRHFAVIESTLALLKIGTMILFSGVAVYILNHFGQEPPVLPPGSRVNSLSSGAPTGGTLALLVTMVLVLVNFQGTELIALSSAETRNPEKNIPRAARNVAMRTLILYVLPLSLLVMIFPWHQAKGEQSVFVQALSSYGFGTFATFLQVVIVSAALSCANIGLYGAARTLYGLGKEGLAPAWLGKVNAHGVPAFATWLTIGVSWAFLPLYIFFENSTFYTWLLSVSGFTGAICWISITWCQIRLRQEMKKKGQSVSSLAYAMPGFPYLSWLSFVLQAFCLGFMVLHPTLRSSLILGIPAFVIPAWICWGRDRLHFKNSGILRAALDKIPLFIAYCFHYEFIIPVWTTAV